jgi:hypothetical protein
MYKMREASSVVLNRVKANVNSEPKGKCMLQVRDKTAKVNKRGGKDEQHTMAHSRQTLLVA